MIEGLLMAAYLAFVGVLFIGLPLLVLIIVYLVAARSFGWPPFRKSNIDNLPHDQV
jgi:hypothetical protein